VPLSPTTSNTPALSEVKISGHRVLVPARYADAYSRVARATGDFFTRERIDSLHALDMKSLLQTIPGVHINDRGMTFQRCEATLSSVKIPGSISGASKEPETSSTSQAHIQVYIDGVRVTDYAGSYGDDAYLAIRYIIPSSVQLVEVYRGVASIPGEFLNDACAVILIWTK
jgi:outer membrane cobalamin receptor